MLSPQRRGKKKHREMSPAFEAHSFSLTESTVFMMSGGIIGAVRQWPAVQAWRGRDGIHRLSTLAGDDVVDVMVSGSNSFSGDMLHLQLLNVSFSKFLEGLKACDLPKECDANMLEDNRTMNFYLAQAPLQKFGGERGPLWALMEDIEPPSVLMQQKEGCQINLWANLERESSSTCHYDPYPNLLCVVAGKKTVWLASPDARHLLRAFPVWDESGNHARRDLRFLNEKSEAAKDQFFQADLHPGDVLFLPEGWYHQVVSQPETLAVNFWWHGIYEAAFESFPHEKYALKRVVQRLLEERKEKLVREILGEMACKQSVLQGLNDDDHKDTELESKTSKVPRLDTNKWMLRLLDGTMAVYRPQSFTHKEYLCLSKLIENLTYNGRPDKKSIVYDLAALLSLGPETFLAIMLLLQRWYPEELSAFLLSKEVPPVAWLIFTSGLEAAVIETQALHVQPPDIGEASKRYDFASSTAIDRDEMRQEPRLQKVKTDQNRPGEIHIKATPEQKEEILETFFQEFFSCVGDRRHVLTTRILDSKKYLSQKAMIHLLQEELDLNELPGYRQ